MRKYPYQGIYWMLAIASFWTNRLHATPEENTKPIEEVIIAASRQTIIDQRGDTGKSVIPRADLERAHISQVKDALDAVQGVETAQAGPGHGSASVFLRGAKSEHTLVLIDGVEISNPALLNRGYDISSLGTAEVERIEVLRGPQSVLYGSSAIGGVINIVTRRPQKPLELSASVSGGAYDTMSEKLHVGTRTESGFYASVGGSHTKSEGPSTTNFDKNRELEKDGRRAYEAVARFGYERNGEHIGITHRHSQSYTDLDQSFGTVWDDENYKTTARDDLTSAVYEKSWTEHWRSRFLVARNWSRLCLNDETDGNHPTDSLQARYEGTRDKWEAQTSWQAHPRWALTVGLDGRNDRASAKAVSASSFGAYEDNYPRLRDHGAGLFLQQEWQITDAWVFTTGVRQDQFKDHDPVATYRGFTRYTLPSATSISASSGTGFSAPSLYQRYSNFGDPELKAERSRSWDVGIEQELGSFLKASLTYFHNRFVDLIDFGATRFENIAEAESFGTESALEARWRPFKFGATYTHLTARDTQTKKTLARRAKDRFTARLAYDNSFYSLQLDGRTVGRRFDAGRWLKAYSVVGLGASAAVDDHWSVFSRIENLTNREYEEIAGYSTLPRSVYFGGSFVL